MNRKKQQDKENGLNTTANDILGEDEDVNMIDEDEQAEIIIINKTAQGKKQKPTTTSLMMKNDMTMSDEEMLDEAEEKSQP